LSISEKQLAANRQNALKSTGPKTPEGKAASRLNALKHGLLARETVINRDDHHEDAAEFESLSDQLREDLAPVGYLEELLVEQITIAYWRLRRAVRADTIEFGKLLRDQISRAADPITIGGSTYPRELISLPDDATLSALNRYEKSIQNDFYRAMNQLERMQSRRESNRTGRSGSSSTSAPALSRNVRLLRSLLAHIRDESIQNPPARNTSPQNTPQAATQNGATHPPSLPRGNGAPSDGTPSNEERKNEERKTNNEQRTTKNAPRTPLPALRTTHNA
jgi:hypothetical protein